MRTGLERNHLSFKILYIYKENGKKNYLVKKKSSDIKKLKNVRRNVAKVREICGYQTLTNNPMKYFSKA